MLLKCKMCGGDMQVISTTGICECEYCGSQQTISKVDDEKIISLYNRANKLRISNEFDKAAGIYESIIASNEEEAEAYWGLCLCKYGIEYVDDPGTGKKIPTCHRTSYESIFNDENFELALENADEDSISIYRSEAKEIDRLQKAIISIANEEKPYDVFICYKETDRNGDRTEDSVIGQDIYEALTDKGLKVFFSRITLEDKLGQEYEPYIFSALNTAKVMIAVGTSYENYNSVWVKNEWGRYLQLMKKDKNKVLIPCYKSIDAYDMPEEFKNFQGQDMSKLGAIQDLVRGVAKILAPSRRDTTIVNEEIPNNNVEAQIKRGKLALFDKEWQEASDFFEKVVSVDTENVEGYLGKLFAEFRVSNLEELSKSKRRIDLSGNYKKACRFADEQLKNDLERISKLIEENNKAEKIKAKYVELKKEIESATDSSKYHEIVEELERIREYKDVCELIEECRNKEKFLRNKEEKFRLKKKRIIISSITGGLLIAGLIIFIKSLILQSHTNNGLIGEDYVNLSEAQCGEIVRFGKGTWKVIDIVDDKKLLFCQDNVGQHDYNDRFGRVTWEKSSIRKYLNDEVYYDYFTEDESKLIITNSTNPDENPKYNTGNGKTCEDKLFLLSILEVENYLISNNERSNGHKWWLRTMGDRETYASYVKEDGSIDCIGKIVNINKCTYAENPWANNKSDGLYIEVRPAVWVDTSLID